MTNEIDVKALAEASYREFEAAQAQAEAAKVQAEALKRNAVWEDARARLVMAVGQELYGALGIEQVDADKFAFVIEDMRWNVSRVNKRNGSDFYWRLVCYQFDPQAERALTDPSALVPAKRDTLFTGDIQSYGTSLELYKPLLTAIGAAPYEKARLAAEDAKREQARQLQLEANAATERGERATLAEDMRVDAEIRAEIEVAKAEAEAALWKWREGAVVPYYRLTYTVGAWGDPEDGTTFDYNTLWTLTDQLDEDGYITGFEYSPRTVKIDPARNLPVFERHEARSVDDLPGCWVESAKIILPGIVQEYSALKAHYDPPADGNNMKNYLYRRDPQGMLHITLGSVAKMWVQEQIAARFPGWNPAPYIGSGYDEDIPL